MTEHVLATGRLGWASRERQTDRYGAIVLRTDGRAWSDFEAGDLLGTWGTLVAEVVETQPDAVGFKMDGPPPSVGLRYTLGEGTLFTETAWREPFGVDVPSIGVRPNDDRETWMNPTSLYRLDEQKVRLFFVC